MSDIVERCSEYLIGGGLWNPELADHDKVRDLVIDCRDEIEQLGEDKAEILEMLKKAHVWHEKLSTLVNNCAVEIERLQQRDGFIAKLDKQIVEKDAEVDRLKEICNNQAMILRRMAPDRFPDTYFIHSGVGHKDQNGMPEKLLVCPAYGVDFNYVYEYTGKTSGTEW